MTHRAIWQTVGSHLQPAPAPRFDGKAPQIATPPPRGADGATIRAELDKLA